MRSVRELRANRERAVKMLEQTQKMTRPDAEIAYAELVDSFDERGGLPEASLPAFWQFVVQSGDATELWSESKYFDRRFVDSFDQWATAQHQ